MGQRPALFLGLLADQPELIAEVGILRWRASGQGGTPGPWIESTSRDAGRDGLPTTLVAMDLDGRALGAVTLRETDPHLDESLCSARSPWVVDLVVRDGERRCGVGRLMVTALEDLARDAGYHRAWVAAGEADADFYRHCCWEPRERLGPTSVTVLTKQLGAELAATS